MFIHVIATPQPYNQTVPLNKRVFQIDLLQYTYNKNIDIDLKKSTKTTCLAT